MKLNLNILSTLILTVLLIQSTQAENTMHLVRISSDRVEIRLKLSEDIAGFQFSLVSNEGVAMQDFVFGPTFATSAWMTGSRLANDTLLNGLAMIMTNRVCLPAGSWVLGSFSLQVRDASGRIDVRFAKALIADQNAQGLDLTSVGLDVEPGTWLAMNGPATSTFDLLPPYPNPFNPSMQLRYTLHQASRVNIAVYDILGRIVSTLVDEQKSEGTFGVIWNGRDGFGTQVASGTYLLAVRVDDQMKVEKVSLKK